jgi:hypothetical protein
MMIKIEDSLGLVSQKKQKKTLLTGSIYISENYAIIRGYDRKMVDGPDAGLIRQNIY